jgi:26S proteasome regulatory subunit N2
MASCVLPSFQAPSSSASGILQYLEEDDISLKVRALQKLHQVIDLHWAEVSSSLSQIEELSEDKSFPASDLAAYIASKCYFHLQEYNESLRLALCAGKYLDISVKCEYIETILAKCIDEYKLLRNEQEEMTIIDPQMEHIIEQMFLRCYRDSCFEQAIGIALDTLRLDKVRETCEIGIKSGNELILNYTFGLCQGTRNIISREFRLTVIDLLVELYGTLSEPDYTNVCYGLQYLNRPTEVAKVMEKLCKGSDENALQAFQIAFDLQEAENQGFVLAIVSNFSALKDSTATPAPVVEGEELVPVVETPVDPIFLDRVLKLRRILVEGFDVDLILNFLFKQSRTDLTVLNSIKTAIEGRTNVLHNATVVAHAFMNSGTTQDNFLRDNITWLGKATNWAKFSSVASIGVINKGHVHVSMKLLHQFLPQGGMTASSYSASGALYALGLIHANKGGSGDSTTIKYLTEELKNSGTNDIMIHGCALGIGLAAMATGDREIFNSLKSVVYSTTDLSTNAGEGAALAIGLLLVGQSDSNLAEEQIQELINHAHDTPHEKIVRAISLSISMMVYGKEESADVIIEQLSRDRDPIIRYGAMFSIAMAYCGTADNNSVRKLLHVAVSDVNDDVRRAAVIALGFVMFRANDTLPKLVSLLAESFNPHVRYGACLAVGIACAGTALKDAIDLLTPLLEDSIDFVRQGALISMALVLQQTAEARSPSVKKFRDQILTVINDKHQPILAKCGAIIASGILDAGGKNVVISMQSKAGFLKMGGAVGMMMFVQYWYWYPLQHMLSLSFAPTMLIGLNKDLNMPVDYEVVCNAPPSMFAYPIIEEKKDDVKKLVTTAVLSTTARAKSREAKKEARKLGRVTSMDIDAPPSSGPSLERSASHLSTTSYLSIDEVKTDEVVKPKKEKEASCFSVVSPSRIIPAQVRFVSTKEDQRYVPVSISRRSTPSGIIMLMDNDQTKPENVSEVQRVVLGQEDEADAFQSFEWDPNDD